MEEGRRIKSNKGRNEWQTEVLVKKDQKLSAVRRNGA